MLRRHPSIFLPLFLIAPLLLISTASVAKTIRAAAPPEGLLALPLLHMIETQPLERGGTSLEFVAWKNPEQLRALVLSGQVDVAAMHTAAAAVMSSKGVPLKLLGLSLGNVLHVLSTNPEIHTLYDLKNKTVAVPFKGEMPDILFRAVLDKAEGIAPGDIRIRYVASSRDAANLLAGGRVEAALIADPHGSILLQKSGKNEIAALYDAIDLQDSWNNACGQVLPLPIAGITAVGPFAAQPESLEEFWAAYAEAVRWCIAHPAEAARLQPDAGNNEEVAEGISQAARKSLLEPVTAAAAKEAIEQFLQLLGRADPTRDATTVPEPGFYWPGN